MMIRSDVIIAVVCAPRWDRAATIVWRATVERGAQPPFCDAAWFQRLIQMTDHAASRRVCAEVAEKLHRHEDLVVCWRLLAADPQNPTNLPALLTTIASAVRGVNFDEHPQLLPRFEVMLDVARGKHAGEFGSLWHLASVHWQDSRRNQVEERAKTRPDLQCDWLAGFATSPTWQTAAARAVARARLCDIVTKEADLDDFTLSEYPAERSRRARAFANAARETDRPLAMAFALLALRTNDPAYDIRDTVNGALGLVGISETSNSDEAKHRLRVWIDVADGKRGIAWTDFFDAAEMYWQDEPMLSSGIDHCVELLRQERWDTALSWLIETTLRHFERRQRQFPDGLHDVSNREAWRALTLSFSDELLTFGHAWSGDLSIAWRMMTCYPNEPNMFIDVLPQVDWMLNHHSIITSPREKALLSARLKVWWMAAAGKWVGGKTSIFRIAYCETKDLDFDESGVAETDTFAPMRSAVSTKMKPPSGPSLVVMGGKRGDDRNMPGVWKDIRDAALPLVIAKDVADVRRAMRAEFPHASQALDMLLRDISDGTPVRVKPTILLGPAGAGKSRMVRRVAEMLGGISVYRFDAAGSHDGTFSGTSKSWSTTQPSVPARAIVQSLIANPIVMVDEIEKAGIGSHNGRLWDALVSFLERETSARHRCASLDVELNLSYVSYIATANSIEALPGPLRDRFRVVRIPAPTLDHLPALAASIMRDLAAEDGVRAYDEPLAPDELDVIGRAWSRERFSMRKLQRLIAATLEARDQCAPRH